MKNKFFTKNSPDLQFEWNAAKKSDWINLQRIFVATYIFAYKDHSLSQLMFEEKCIHEANKIWDSAYQRGLEAITKEIIKPLQFYFQQEKTILLNYKKISAEAQKKLFKTELDELEKHFVDKSQDITSVREYFSKLIMLQKYFENDFSQEKQKLDSGTKKLDYLVVRFHDIPIAFFVCELNPKSACIYLRWVTVEPSFQREGLGKIILDKISQRYPDAIGMELYTRKVNSSNVFYKNCGFHEATNFEFGKPVITLKNAKGLYFPEDDATNSPNAFIAFHKSNHSNQFKI